MFFFRSVWIVHHLTGERRFLGNRSAKIRVEFGKFFLRHLGPAFDLSNGFPDAFINGIHWFFDRVGHVLAHTREGGPGGLLAFFRRLLQLLHNGVLDFQIKCD